MKSLCIVLLLALAACAQELPDAPQPQLTSSSRDTLTPLTWHRTLHSKTFWAAHGVLLAATVYDVEVTHAGLAHHKCVENGENLYPSRGYLYKTNLPIIAAFTVGDLVLRKMGVPFGYYAPPIVGSAKHFYGGSKWLTQCW